MTVTESPATSISVILCTRDRPAQLARAIAAILRGTRRDFELIVVDQSASDVSAAALSAASADDGRVTLVRDHGVGASRARNIGAATAHGGILVFTDDDCEAKADWLERLVAALEADDAVGIAFGAVIPAPCDPRDGFIVGFVPDRRRRLTGRLGKWFDSGISANMALRRTALDAVGGFDEMLGTGAYFPSAEDIDIAYRVLRAGFPLLHVPGSVVIHYGLRDWRSGSALMRRTYLAVAAAYMKHIKRS
jgi:GT2 family glycosyltransferase